MGPESSAKLYPYFRQRLDFGTKSLFFGVSLRNLARTQNSGGCPQATAATIRWNVGPYPRRRPARGPARCRYCAMRRNCVGAVGATEAERADVVCKSVHVASVSFALP